MFATEKISIIVVAYNSFDKLKRLLKTIPEGQEVIIVDNGQDDGFRDAAEKLGVKLLVPEENLGFGGGCNLGATEAAGDLLLFLNPDTQIYPDTLEQFLLASNKYSDASAFGASLEYEDGRAYACWDNHLTPRVDERSARFYSEDTQVPMLMGAALMVRREAFEAVGGFDDNIFMFFEDDDLCLRLQKEQGPTMFIANARVVHTVGGSSAPSWHTERLKGYHWYRSMVYVYRKHNLYGARKVANADLRNFAIDKNLFWSNTRRNQVFGRVKAMLEEYFIK